MYDIIQHEVYWAQVANDVFKIVKDCCKCTRNSVNTRQVRHLKLLPALRPLEIISMHILCPLQKTTNGNQFVVVMIG